MTSGSDLTPALYLVSTPIGAARDITLRALDILREAPVLVAEDTRTLRRLMEIHGIARDGRPILAYHDHSGTRMRDRIVAEIASGKAVAYASEAGTPLVADPGYQLVGAVHAAGLLVRAAPGASAVLAALAVSGLPTDRFFFAGFAPPQQKARETYLETLRDIPGTLVFYEAPTRIHEMLEACVRAFGAEREAVLCRELTKRFEERRAGRLQDLAADVAANPPRGEIVLLVDRGIAREPDEEEVSAALRAALSRATVKDAASEVATAFALPRRQIYQLALQLSSEDGAE